MILTEKKIENIKNTLERKLRMITNNKGHGLYFFSVIEYHEYICRSLELLPIIQELIAEDRIPSIYLKQIFNDFMLSGYLKREVPKEHYYPNFYDEQVDEKYGLMENFIKLTGNDYEDYKKHPNLVHLNPDIPSIRSDREEQFYYTQRLHNDIVEKLEQLNDLWLENIDFNPKTSVLYFNGKEITISKQAESDPHELLKTIFKDKERVWNNDEILDDWKFDVEKKTPKTKVYQAGRSANRIIAQETTIKDFLDVTTKTVSINKKYLKK